MYKREDIEEKKVAFVVARAGEAHSIIEANRSLKAIQPSSGPSIGIAALPKNVRLSSVLTSGDLELLGNAKTLPGIEEVDLVSQLPEVKEILDATIGDSTNRERELHELAKQFIESDKVDLALKIVLF